MRTPTLMPDYRYWPLWEAGETIDPADLSLSTGLQARLVAWADVFDAALNRGRSGQFAADMTRELGAGCQVLRSRA